MKKTILCFAALLMVVLSGCGNKKQAVNIQPQTNIVDALSVSMDQATSGYSQKALACGEYLDVSDIICLDNECYYIGTTSNEYEIRKINLQDLSGECICSFDPGKKTPIDISIASNMHLYVLLLDTETEDWHVLEMNNNGEVISSFHIDTSDMTEMRNLKQILVHEDLVYLLGGGYLCAVRMDKQLRPEFKIQIEASAVMTQLSDGSVIVGQNERNSYNLYRVDAKTARLVDKISFNLPFIKIRGGYSSNMLLDDGSSLYSFSMADGRFEKLFIWNHLGIIGDSIAELDDGSFLCIGRQSFSAAKTFFQISDKLGNNVTDLEISPIILFTVSETDIRYDVKDAIRQWNAIHTNTPIIIRDYAAYYDGENPRSAELKMAADLIAGNLPDIYDLSALWNGANLSTGPLVRRGMLENLYPYIDRDVTLSREDFIPGVLSSMEINNGLYELVLDYRYVTSFAYALDVGDPDDWTYEKLNKLIDENERYSSVFTTHFGRLEWLQMAIAASGSKLIDWETFECYFDSAYFVNLLHAASQIPVESEVEGGMVMDMIRNGDGALFLCYMSSIWEANGASPVFGENCAFVGFPEVGNVIWPQLSFGISSYSKHKEECWEFLRQFVLPEYPIQAMFSIRQDVMRSEITEELKRAQEGGYADKQPYLESSMRTVLDLLNAKNAVYRHDPQVWEIVSAEVEAFFSNQRSAEETAKIIQSRVSLYLSEQS